jgi:hypothetical protein
MKTELQGVPGEWVITLFLMCVLFLSTRWGDLTVLMTFALMYKMQDKQWPVVPRALQQYTSLGGGVRKKNRAKKRPKVVMISEKIWLPSGVRGGSQGP